MGAFFWDTLYVLQFPMQFQASNLSINNVHNMYYISIKL